MPGFYVSKDGKKRLAHSAHVVVMKKGNVSAVTVMPDYQGPLEPFALVLAVPADVTIERVAPLKREFIDRVEKMTAPRFHEWWEMNPCEPGRAEQEWERSLAAQSDTAFLGGATPAGGGSQKVAKELFLDVQAKTKDAAEYTFSLIAPDQDAAAALKEKGYILSPEALAAVKPYRDAGMQLLVADIDPNRIELIGGDRAILSPLRYWSETSIDKLPVRLSLLSSPGMQELFVYVFHPDSRYHAKNYENVFPPTNVKVDYVVKERMGEFYAGIHDIILKKQPRSFLNEFAWSTKGCGQPCPTEPLMIHELLSMGGDAFEQFVPEEERNPEPPEPTEEETKAFEASLDKVDLEGKKIILTPKEKRDRKKTWEDERKTIAQRKALVDRHYYVLSRLHHRYDDKLLPVDLEIAPANHVQGGIWLPKGPNGDLPMEVKPGSESRLQIRYTHFHPDITVIKCDKPERWRWMRMPRHVRILRKIWVADDMARRNRQQIKPAEVVRTSIPGLGLTAKALPPDGGAEGGVDGGEATGTAGKSCGCRVPRGSSTSGLGLAAAFALAALAARRRRSIGNNLRIPSFVRRKTAIR
jgi:MYXO-CTERM domain-containing protein